MAVVRHNRGGFANKESRVMFTEGGLSRFIKSLPNEIKVEVRKSVSAWGRDIRDRAKALAPVSEGDIERRKGVTKAGTLRNSIRAGVFNGGMAARAGVFGRGKKAAWYAFFVEYGTNPHYTQKLSRRKGVKASFAKSGAGMHPGVRERPFIRPAAQAAGPEGARRVIEAVRVALRQASAGCSSGRLIPAAQALGKIEAAAREIKASSINIDPFNGKVDEI